MSIYGCSILTAQPLDRADCVAELEQRGAATRIHEDQRHVIEVSLPDEAPRFHHGSERRSLLWIEMEGEISPEERAAIAKSTGVDVSERLTVIVSSAEGEDQKIAAGVALWLADRYGGLIGYCGQLEIVRSLWHRLTGRDKQLKRLRARVHPEAWRVGTGDGDQESVSSADFLERWVDHPEFHLLQL